MNIYIVVSFIEKVFLFLSPVWYILHTFNCQELRVGDYLASKGKTYFIPMMYKEKVNREGRHKRVLLPVVHNLVFLQKDDSEVNLLSLLSESPVLVYVLRKQHTQDFVEVPDREMLEFRTLCDPNFSDVCFVSDNEAEMKPGKMVEVVHGPFKGMVGKLHRAQGKFYFIRSLAGLGVMIRISRWYCKALKCIL